MNASESETPLQSYFDSQADRYDELCSHLEFQLTDAFDYACRFLTRELDQLNEPHLLELGVGTGSFTEYLLGSLPRARLLGLDLSGSMLSQAAKRLRPWQQRVQLEEGDFREGIPGVNYDAVVSAMTFQFYGINHGKVLRRIHRALAGGGCLLTVLNVSSENSANDGKLCDMLESSAAIPDEDKDWLRQARGRSRYCPAPPSWYLGLLRRAGYIDRECIYLRYGVAIFIARKPTAQGFARRSSSDRGHR